MPQDDREAVLGKALCWPSWKDIRVKAVTEQDLSKHHSPELFPQRQPVPHCLCRGQLQAYLPSPTPIPSYTSPLQLARVACGHGW